MSASQFPSLEAKQSSKRCTNCSSLMSLYQLPGHYGQTLDIDACLDCNAIWFDQWESTQLSPDGVVALFQVINERGGAASSAGAKFGEGLRCVSCGDGMKMTNDRVKNTRFTYQACRQGHGRFTTFYNFLAEKQFVRELTAAERSKLAVSVKQIKCSGCGAPVDLGKTDACGYCRAPVSVFDRDAAKKAIEHYLQERGKQLPSRPTHDYGHRSGYAGSGRDGTWDALYAADIATDLLWALGRAASRGLSGAGRSGVATGAGSGAAGALADTGSAVSGGLLNSLPAVGGGDGLRSATDALFGDAAGAGGLISSTATDMLGDGALSSVSDALPSATDALFGLGGTASSDTFSSIADSVSSSIGSVGGGAFESISSGAVDSIADVASSGGDGIVDLVSDGIGSLLGGLFD
jgi:hypothetical protein